MVWNLLIKSNTYFPHCFGRRILTYSDYYLYQYTITVKILLSPSIQHTFTCLYYDSSFCIFFAKLILVTTINHRIILKKLQNKVSLCVVENPLHLIRNDIVFLTDGLDLTALLLDCLSTTMGTRDNVIKSLLLLCLDIRCCRNWSEPCHFN